ncbi:MAG TPA: SRPBCC family protein [Tepidisphaeraceae bacterium]|jgi:uncharacterized protein YndB with AHSA1/START domain|nr:SRPBCC family protein [Tepidisphaeraceae bacterium]
MVTADREISATRVFDAPRELVFKMWTDPKHVDQWWGPRGFSTKTKKMEFKPRGVWEHIMHGPDGTEYPNWIEYLEIVEPKRLVYDHGSNPKFQVTVKFEDIGGKRTKLTMRMVFETAQLRDATAKKFGAVEGLGQTLDRLAEQVGMKENADRPFVISRVFDAPRTMMWKAWTERDQLMQWFGPKGFKITTANLDFTPGGIFHYCMQGPDGKEMWGKFVYREIIKPEQIVLVNSFSDEKGGMTRHPFSANWPREMLTTTTLVEHDRKTTLSIQWEPLNATAEERATFNAARDGMKMGWTGTFEQLSEYLGER